MILVRNVFQAKYGRGDELVQLIKEAQPILAKYGMGRQRILTDLAGPFFTVVMEIEAEDLADYERSREAFADPEFGSWFERMTEFVESGSREFFTARPYRVPPHAMEPFEP